jgi:c-di-GMP-related signal transduction protein
VLPVAALLELAVSGSSNTVQSVRHGITLLGERELVRWIRMATTLIMGQEKCSDLILASLVRARFCELIAPKVNHGSCDLFLIGMFSLMDAILEVPMGVVIEGLAFDAETRTELRSDGVARGRRVECGSQTREEAQPVFSLREPGVQRRGQLGSRDDNCGSER